jgi:hypothetical protein
LDRLSVGWGIVPEKSSNGELPGIITSARLKGNPRWVAVTVRMIRQKTRGGQVSFCRHFATAIKLGSNHRNSMCF